MHGCRCTQATLERLKLRFGDLAMHNNSIMLKDVDDSRRVNALINTALEKAGEASAVVFRGRRGWCHARSS